ncbi:MAG: prepilin-type N-terminal cleavage/methylation domain-containing protein [Candidatus Saccharimonadaceae bacterium]
MQMTAKSTSSTSFSRGFTIVELLVVIVLIAIIATITIVAYNGIQIRAQESALATDFRNNSQRLRQYSVINGALPTPTETQTISDAKISLSTAGNYKLASYCSGALRFAIAAETNSGKKYYTDSGNTIVNNDSISITGICATLGITKSDGSAADSAYIGMSSTSCASEGGTCVVSGTKSVAYGANGMLAVKSGLTGNVPCTNANFGDPAPGFGKKCYIIDYSQ